MIVLQELLGLEFKHVVGAEVWHEDVTMVTNLSKAVTKYLYCTVLYPTR